MLYLLDYGAGSKYWQSKHIHKAEPIQEAVCQLSLCPSTISFSSDVRSLANSITKLGYEFKWVQHPDDIAKADVSILTQCHFQSDRGGEGGSKKDRMKDRTRWDGPASNQRGLLNDSSSFDSYRTIL